MVDVQNAVLVGYTRLVVTAGPALHYPNPPGQDEVFYLDGYHTPIVIYEPGAEITFDIQVLGIPCHLCLRVALLIQRQQIGRLRFCRPAVAILST